MSIFLLLHRRRNKRNTRTSAIPATPPTVPPTIAEVTGEMLVLDAAPAAAVDDEAEPAVLVELPEPPPVAPAPVPDVLVEEVDSVLEIDDVEEWDTLDDVKLLLVREAVMLRTVPTRPLRVAFTMNKGKLKVEVPVNVVPSPVEVNARTGQKVLVA